MKVYEQVIFLQGDEADEALDILDEDGEAAALNFLKQWHYPGEHDTRADPGAGTSDETYESDGYTLVYNTGLEYIGLEFEADE